MLNFFTSKKEEEKKNPFAPAFNEILDNAFEAAYPEFDDFADEELNEEEMDFENTFEAIDDEEMNGLAQDAEMEIENVVAQVEAAAQPKAKARRGRRK